MAKRMLSLGESGRYEFKSDLKSVTPSLFATLANWVALDHQRGVAHLLVGVSEEVDEATGLVRGVPCGLRRGLDHAVEVIQNIAKETRPIPVDIFVVEEGVGEPMPFVRVEVRPTMAPHYDAEGRRQTRQGRSTRALTDDELLRIYLDREAGSFTARFRQTSTELAAAVGAIGSQVDEMAEAIEQGVARPVRELTEVARRAGSAADWAASSATSAEDAATIAASAASSAESTASAVSYDVGNLESVVSELRDLVHELGNGTPEALADRVADERRVVWWQFSTDTWERTSDRSRRLAEAVRSLLSSDISLDSVRNTWELAIWHELLADRERQRAQRGSLKWWETAVGRVNEFMERPAYRAPDLPDIRAELQTGIDNVLNDETSETVRFARLLE